MKTEVAIVGGGLSGLALARHLHRQNIDFQLFEARSRFGGRIKTHKGFDLGPSWFWPGQNHMASLARDLDIQIYEQYSRGAVSYESENGDVLRNVGFASMQGSWRIKGGMSALIDGIIAQLPSERLHLDHVVSTLAQPGSIEFEHGVICQANRIALALPPRIAAELTYEPKLAPEQLNAMTSIPTWMAGHAKFVAIYEEAFWRTQGLSGDATSRCGPLAEIHDASLSSEIGDAALFGFVGVPFDARQNNTEALKQAALAQLARIFGPRAQSPKEVILQDWAAKPYTATTHDHTMLSHHPTYGLPPDLKHLWDGTLYLCSTEASPEMGGYLEGALAIAYQTATFIKNVQS